MILRRTLFVLLRAIINVSLVVTFLFFVVRVIPTDPAAILLGTEATPESLERLRTEMGLDRPLVAQYWTYLTDLAKLDVGESLLSRRDIGNEIAVRIPRTVSLAGISMLVAVVLGVSAGAVMTTKEGTFAAGLLRRLASILIAVPAFVIGIVFLALGYAIVHQPGVLPPFFFWMAVMALAVHMAGYLALASSGVFSSISASPFIEAAYSRGLSRRRVAIVHMLRAGAVPLLVVSVTYFGVLIGNAVLVEGVFVLPGLGSLIMNAVLRADYPMVQGAGLVIALLVIGSQALADIAIPWLDPRVGG